MFELADRLVGIYKTDNTTKTVAIAPNQFTMPRITAPPQVCGCVCCAWLCVCVCVHTLVRIYSMSCVLHIVHEPLRTHVHTFE